MTAPIATGRTILVVVGGTAKEAGLDGHLIAPTKLQQIAAKPAK